MTKQGARLIIPLWGEAYASKLVSMTLPALLAPGNLPALSAIFDVELVLVTETGLFDAIRNAKSFQRVSNFCRVQFVSLDDLMTDVPGDYGVVLTYALHRGFVDLGERMTETYLLFLNADFIICDGSLRHLGKLMQEGKRVIHAPSFRVVLEETWPKLQDRVDPSACTLSLTAREMVRLALDHKHLTVKARIVNQRLFHQEWMDQFYWYVDEDTLIGYQWPVALVAIKPERIVREPVLVWDYGFIPEAAPTAERHFIGDSDDFFMLEPQRSTSGEEMVRFGWVSVDGIAANLSKWTTKEQRECGQQLLTIHAADLPPNMPDIVKESQAYMAQIMRRLSGVPQPHIGHGHLGAWFEAAKERMKGRRPSAQLAPEKEVAGPAGGSSTASLSRFALSILRTLYRTSFGSPPEVGPFHPLWLDTHYVMQRIREWKKKAARTLWLTSRHSLFHTVLEGRHDTSILLLDGADGWLRGATPYDACLCELTIDELATLNRLYARIRSLMRPGGEVVFLVSTQRNRLLATDDVDLCRTAFPDVDVSEIHFFGTALSKALRRLYLRASNSFVSRPLYRAATTAFVLLALAPLVRLANALAARRDSSIFSPAATSIVVRFTAKSRMGAPISLPSDCRGVKNDGMQAVPAAMSPTAAAGGRA